MRKLFIILTIVPFFTFSQSIELGQDYNTVSSLIKYFVNNNNERKTYGNNLPKMSYEIKYGDNNTRTIETYQEEVQYIDLRLKSNTIVKYVFDNNMLVRIKKSLTNISLAKLKLAYENYYHRNKIGVLYFSNDYKNYSQVKIDDQYPTIVYEAFDHDQFPEEFYTEVFKRQKQYEDNKGLRESKSAKRKSLLLDYFNIDDYIENYSTDIIPQLEKLISKEFIQDLSESISYSEKGTTSEIKGNCNIHYYSPEGSTLNRVDFDCQDLKVNYINLIKEVRFRIPEIKETFEGKEYLLNREFFMDLEINLKRGTAVIKHKKGKKTDFIKQSSLTQDQKQWISEKIKDKKSGKYYIKFQFGQLNDKDCNAAYISEKLNE
ncbi:hypothetical protein Q4Q34_03220 [Flavivirga abyssicola]|uniref:hypothetical protein n=1 Tax=Flavivirga abyssicola TaxID=3063533 RepID=UPI0026DFE660|nr:hypothetical protein [Flavivirga sp. MEBiC07777]WVK14043.1 hypothetical protein Q4Q34_03220 [Flavivirga sp. MEBiC07777]